MGSLGTMPALKTMVRLNVLASLSSFLYYYNLNQASQCVKSQQLNKTNVSSHVLL
jgi:hypothetical protein